MMTSKVAIAASMLNPKPAWHCSPRTSEPKPDYQSFQVGDIVTRGDGDQHRIISITPDRFSMRVECIKAPLEGFTWCKVGEIESNLCNKYRYALESIASDEDRT